MISSLPAWIIFFPFSGALVMGILYLSAPGNLAHRPLYAVIGVGMPLLAFVFSIWAVGDLLHLEDGAHITCTLFPWITIGSFTIDVAWTVDHLSAMMLLMITFVGLLIHLYAVGYMWDDKGFGKFFAYFNFFLGAMLVLILADNPIILFVGWELVGLASYLLIGYYHQDPANIKAANKAFILNRVGDFGFVSGLALLFTLQKQSGFDFASIFAGLSMIDTGMLSLVGLLLFVGAVGKSAQIPLYVWLPDAMAGPTPVSALIHAATMVTAGVYMVARFAPLYNRIPDVGVLIASVGAASALLAALFAAHQNDIKKILAYSTMSQLGYMFIAVGLGGYSHGIFHLFVHGFFKALLFMGAGAVIIALHHEQDIFKMGGLRNKMPRTHATMLIAVLTISGIPVLSGFFSKDAILAYSWASGHTTIWAMGVLSAYWTAYYMFRLYFVVFVAPPRAPQSPKPLSRLMTDPLIVLAVGSLVLGFWNLPASYGGSMWFGQLIQLPDRTVPLAHGDEYLLDGFNVLVALWGIWVAWRRFGRSDVPMRPPIYGAAWQKALANTLYIDGLYDRLIVIPLRGMSWFLDRVVDPRIVDGLIHSVIRLYRTMAMGFARLQNGNVRWYALYILLGVSGVSLYVLAGTGGG